MGNVDVGADEFVGFHALSTDSFSISQLKGGNLLLRLQAGLSHGGNWYLIFGTLSGIVPGQPLPGGKAILPINFDEFTFIIIKHLNTAHFRNFMSILDGDGMASAYLNLRSGNIPIEWVGTKMNFAFTVDALDLASNPIEVSIQP